VYCPSGSSFNATWSQTLGNSTGTSFAQLDILHPILLFIALKMADQPLGEAIPVKLSIALLDLPSTLPGPEPWLGLLATSLAKLAIFPPTCLLIALKMEPRRRMLIPVKLSTACWILIECHLVPNLGWDLRHLHLCCWLFRLQCFCALHSKWQKCNMGKQSLSTGLLLSRVLPKRHLAQNPSRYLWNLYLLNWLLCSQPSGFVQPEWECSNFGRQSLPAMGVSCIYLSVRKWMRFLPAE